MVNLPRTDDREISVTLAESFLSSAIWVPSSDMVAADGSSCAHGPPTSLTIFRRVAGTCLHNTDERYLLEALESESVLRACLFRYTRNAADVDELLQETYARLLTPRPAEQPELQSVRAFALGIARNLALDWLRHQKVVELNLVADLESLNVLDEGNQVEEIVNAHQELELLAAAIEELPPKCREVFVLRKVHGRSQKEIAAHLGLSENTVEQHLVKATRRCAQSLFDTPLVNRRSTWVTRVRKRLRKDAESS